MVLMLTSSCALSRRPVCSFSVLLDICSIQIPTISLQQLNSINIFCIWGFLLELLPNFCVFLYSHTQFSNVTILGVTFQPIVHFVPLLLRNGARHDAHSSDVVPRKALKMLTWPLRSLSHFPLISETQLWLSESIWLLAIEVCKIKKTK